MTLKEELANIDSAKLTQAAEANLAQIGQLDSSGTFDMVGRVSPALREFINSYLSEHVPANVQDVAAIPPNVRATVDGMVRLSVALVSLAEAEEVRAVVESQDL